MKRNRISEATGSGNAGNFKVPIVLSPQPWTEDQVAPFTNPVYSYNNAELAYEEADGDFKETPEERARIERRTDKISKVDAYLKSFYTGQNDEDGSNIGDIEPPEKIIRQAVGPLKEDLAVWFGTKKKPKGSSQPKGPWVNICRKKEGGGHPPCGRPEASDKGYPKCRAAGVASKMTDSEKRNACQQKRKAEKSHNKSGTGNSPKMVSYKPKNESMKKTIKLTESELINLVKKVLKEESEQLNNDKKGIFKNKPERILYLCNDDEKEGLPQNLYTKICDRPTVVGGSLHNDSIDVFCDKDTKEPIIEAESNNGTRVVSYNCQTKEVGYSNEANRYGVPDAEKQKVVDQKWLSAFCTVFEFNPRRFKSCLSKVR